MPDFFIVDLMDQNINNLWPHVFSGAEVRHSMAQIFVWTRPKSRCCYGCVPLRRFDGCCLWKSLSRIAELRFPLYPGCQPETVLFQKPPTFPRFRPPSFVLNASSCSHLLCSLNHSAFASAASLPWLLRCSSLTDTSTPPLCVDRLMWLLRAPQKSR